MARRQSSDLKCDQDKGEALVVEFLQKDIDINKSVLENVISSAVICGGARD